jgi:DNA-binding XRE family transcriptional regulator/desulfoferrodoxin (superoxide reductase-like protein)
MRGNEMSYITGKIIKELREKQRMTQKQLAEKLNISDKTISKWETDRGLPDISIVDSLAKALGVSVAELFAGEFYTNTNLSGNMRKTVFYVCPVCGNIIAAAGQGSFSCCGITLPPLEAEPADTDHGINIEVIDGEYYISSDHEMSKQHFISFIAFAAGDRVDIVKMYPQQDVSARIRKSGHGIFYMCCNRHGLYKKLV